jgi:putative membrane protein
MGFLRSWPILLLAAARASWGIVVALAVVLVVWRALVWERTTWSIDADGLVLRSGILRRNVQTVPPQRVQQVEIRRALRHRVSGLAAVRVGLAGGGESNQVELDALSLPDAERLHTVLEQLRAGQTVTVAAPLDSGAPSGSLPPPVMQPAPVTVLAVGTRQLVTAGLTSRSLWLAPLAVLAGLVQFLGDVGLEGEATGALRSRLGDASPAITIVVMLVVAVVFAVVSTVVTNHGLTVVRTGGDLAIRRGLLEQRSVVVPRRRVQTVGLGTNVARAWLGLASVEIRTADLGGTGEAASSISVPIGDRLELERLLPELLSTADPTIPTHRHPPEAVRREISRRALRTVPATALLGFVVDGAVAATIGAVLGLMLAVATGWPAGRRRRSGWAESTLVTESGLFVWRRWIVPVDRVQSVATVQNPFQRRLGLMTVRLDVAGSPGGVTLRDLGVGEAEGVVALTGSGGVDACLHVSPTPPVTTVSPPYRDAHTAATTGRDERNVP